jgi:hypothetical protein
MTLLEEIDLFIRQTAEMREASRQTTGLALAFRSSNERLITRSKDAIAQSRKLLANRQRWNETEFAHLRLADDHISQARVHLQRQHQLIARLSRKGIPTDLAERVAATMQITLQVMEGHRVLIREKLGIT